MWQVFNLLWPPTERITRFLLRREFLSSALKSGICRAVVHPDFTVLGWGSRSWRKKRAFPKYPIRMGRKKKNSALHTPAEPFPPLKDMATRLLSKTQHSSWEYMHWHHRHSYNGFYSTYLELWGEALEVCGVQEETTEFFVIRSNYYFFIQFKLISIFGTFSYPV